MKALREDFRTESVSTYGAPCDDLSLPIFEANEHIMRESQPPPPIIQIIAIQALL